MNPTEHYILDQPEPYKSVLIHLQLIIEQTVPDVNLKYKYRIPFYYLKGKPFCYLNVSQDKQFVDVGFWKAPQITIHPEHMVSENRKMIRSLRYRQLQDINNMVLTDVLREASALY